MSLPQPEPVRDATQSYRAWDSFEIECAEPKDRPLPVTQPSFATLPTQLLPYLETPHN
jgi:hypothetical protein